MMGCIYEDGDGECQFFDENNVDNSPNGCDKKDGGCMVSDDPDPSVGCEQYESDSTCFDCGADFNQDEHCTCGDE